MSSGDEISICVCFALFSIFILLIFLFSYYILSYFWGGVGGRGQGDVE